MSRSYVLAIDQGTTGSTVMLIDDAINLVCKANQEFEQIYPKPGWVEHDPEAIWRSVLTALEQVMQQSNVDPKAIKGIGITNQRETTVIWDRKTGKAVHNAIVWQDRRTAPRCEQLKSDGLEQRYRQNTGLVLDPYFSGTKIAWLLDNVDGLRSRAENGDLAFGTIDSYLIWRLTNGQAHVTDVSNASRTLLFNIESLSWDDQLLEPLAVPSALLPEVVPSSAQYGTTADVPGLPDGIPVAGAAGDQQSALFGQACFEVGAAKCTYGTGAFLLVNTGDKLVRSENGLLTTVAWKLGDRVSYALEGSAFIAGAAVQWLRDGLGLVKEAKEIEALASSVEDSGGVTFVPALTGLGAPHWRPEARGVISGITRGTTSAHLARATLEGIALQIYDLAEAMASDLGRPLTSFRVDGGAVANQLLMQFQADILDLAIVRPQVIETTALGAALLAGLATGVWSDQSAVSQAWQQDRRFEPAMSDSARQGFLTQWQAAVNRA